MENKPFIFGVATSGDNFTDREKENLRDNMTNRELVLNMLAELSTKDISAATNPETMEEHKEVAKRGGGVARKARLQLETETGQKVVTPLNAKNTRTIK